MWQGNCVCCCVFFQNRERNRRVMTFIISLLASAAPLGLLAVLDSASVACIGSSD